MNIEEIHNINLLPFEIENYTSALKNYVLFSQVDDKTIIYMFQYLV